MWHPPVVTVPPAAEPISLDEVKARARVDTTADDADIALMIAEARALVESWTGTMLVQRTVTVACDGWADLARLGVAPVQSVSSIAYVDATGDDQMLSADLWELRAEGDTLDPAVVPQHGTVWPSIRPQSRITLTAVAGYSTVPDEIVGALLLLTAYRYDERSAANVGNIVNEMPFGVEVLLSNRRRGV